MRNMTTAQIGRCGEILVQYRLLKHGIDSAPMTTDYGIDLVAFAPQSEEAFTIQVKTNLRSKAAGGKGEKAFDWWLDEKNPAELAALVELESERIWLFRRTELEKSAQQRSKGRMHFYLYADPNYSPKRGGTHVRDFSPHEIDSCVADLFGLN